MIRAETGEARVPALHAVLSAATYALELAIIAVSVFGLGGAALLLPASNPAATPLWPPTGVALALVLLRGYRVWPALLVGCFSARAIYSGAITAGSLLESGSIGIGATLAALAGAWLINRWSSGRKTFATPLGIAKFALVAFAPTAMISSAIATAGLALTNVSGFADSAGAWSVSTLSTWATWWLADAAATVIVAPVIVLWAMA